MHWLMHILRRLTAGAATGGAVVLLASLFGFLGGGGWHRTGAGKALGVALILLLLFLLAVILSTEYGRHVGLRLTEEEHEKRTDLIPFVLGMCLVVLAAYLVIQPPPLATVPS